MLGLKKPYNKHNMHIHTYIHTCVHIIIMISHFDFLVGGGDGDGDSGVSGAPIYM